MPTKIISKFIVFLVLILSGFATEASQYGINDIANDKELLRYISSSIFKRAKDIEYIEDKMCTHGQEMYEVWAKNRWKDLDTTQRQKIQSELETKGINKTQSNRVLRREDFALLAPEIIKDYQAYATTVIEKGEPVLIKSTSNNHYLIKITHRFANTGVGQIAVKQGNSVNATSTSVLQIVFDVDDIIQKILVGGKNAWNPNTDGFASTFCPDNN